MEDDITLLEPTIEQIFGRAGRLSWERFNKNVSSTYGRGFLPDDNELLIQLWKTRISDASSEVTRDNFSKLLSLFFPLYPEAVVDPSIGYTISEISSVINASWWRCSTDSAAFDEELKGYPVHSLLVRCSRPRPPQTNVYTAVVVGRHSERGPRAHKFRMRGHRLWMDGGDDKPVAEYPEGFRTITDLVASLVENEGFRMPPHNPEANKPSRAKKSPQYAPSPPRAGRVDSLGVYEPLQPKKESVEDDISAEEKSVMDMGLGDQLELIKILNVRKERLAGLVDFRPILIEELKKAGRSESSTSILRDEWETFQAGRKEAYKFLRDFKDIYETKLPREVREQEAKPTRLAKPTSLEKKSGKMSSVAAAAKDKLPKRAKPASALSEGQATELSIDAPGVADRLLLAQTNLDDDKSTVIAFGEMKSGKSTFFNVLLNRDILPTAAIACTSAITELVYPKEEGKPMIRTYVPAVRESSSDELHGVVELPKSDEEIRSYLKEVGTKLKRGGVVSRVEIELIHDVLANHIRLVDSPGMNDESRLTERVEEYLPNAIGCIVLLNASQGGVTKTVRNLIYDALAKGVEPSAFIFIISKWDHLNTEEDRIGMLKQSHKTLGEILQKQLNEGDGTIVTMNLQGALRGLNEFGIRTPQLKRFNTALQNFLASTFRAKLKRSVDQLYGPTGMVTAFLKLVQTQLAMNQLSIEDRRARKAQVGEALERIERNQDMNIQALHLLLCDARQALVARITAALNDTDLPGELVAELKKKHSATLGSLGQSGLREAVYNKVIIIIQQRLQCQLPEVWAEEMDKLRAKVRGMFRQMDHDDQSLTLLLYGGGDEFTPRHATGSVVYGRLGLQAGGGLLGCSDPTQAFEEIHDANVAETADDMFSKMRLNVGFTFMEQIRKLLRRAFGRFEGDVEDTEECVKIYVQDALERIRKKNEGDKQSVSADMVKQMFKPETLKMRVENFLGALVKLNRDAFENISDSDLPPAEVASYELAKMHLSSLKERLAGFYIDCLTKWEFDLSKIEDMKRIGGGTYGNVFKVSYEGTTMAMKELLRQPGLYSNFESEWNVMRALGKKGEQVVEYFGAAVREGGSLCLLMEFVELGDISKFIHTYPVDYRTKLQLLISAAKAIRYVARKGYVHRDIKGDNLLLTRDGIVKVADFGLSKAEAECFSLGIGTLRYMAPEIMPASISVAESKPLPPAKRAVDVYSFGVVAYEVVLEEHGFYHCRSQPMVEFMTRIKSGRNKLYMPEGGPLAGKMQALIRKCTMRHPSDRPDWEIIISDLQRIIAEEGGPHKDLYQQLGHILEGKEDTDLPPIAITMATPPMDATIEIHQTDGGQLRFDRRGGIDIVESEMSDVWKDAFKSAGLEESDWKDPITARVIADVIVKSSHGVVGAIPASTREGNGVVRPASVDLYALDPDQAASIAQLILLQVQARRSWRLSSEDEIDEPSLKEGSSGPRRLHHSTVGRVDLRTSVEIKNADSSSRSAMRCRAKWAFAPEGTYEIQLHAGDILTIEDLTDGWYYGENTSTKERGRFPENYVEVL